MDETNTNNPNMISLDSHMISLKHEQAILRKKSSCEQYNAFRK